MEGGLWPFCGSGRCQAGDFRQQSRAKISRSGRRFGRFFAMRSHRLVSELAVRQPAGAGPDPFVRGQPVLIARRALDFMDARGQLQLETMLPRCQDRARWVFVQLPITRRTHLQPSGFRIVCGDLQAQPIRRDTQTGSLRCGQSLLAIPDMTGGGDCQDQSALAILNAAAEPTHPSAPPPLVAANTDRWRPSTFATATVRRRGPYRGGPDSSSLRADRPGCTAGGGPSAKATRRACRSAANRPVAPAGHRPRGGIRDTCTHCERNPAAVTH